MSAEDFIYLVLLLFSIAFGYPFRFIPRPYKKYVGTIVGISIILIASGWHIIHQLLSTTFTILLIKFGSKRYCHVISFFVLFSYIMFFRLCHYFGIPRVPPESNAVQMMMTLKLVGICYEIHDTWEKEGRLKKIDDGREKAKLQLELKHEGVYPSQLDIFHYAFCYIGVLTGPYYKYRAFHDALSGKWQNVDCFEATKKRILYFPLYAGVYLICSSVWPLSYAKSVEIMRDRSFLYRVWYMTPTFFNFRMRIYSGFVLSECVCIMAGLGAYPKESEPKPGKGPTDYAVLEKLGKRTADGYNFETIHNIDEWNSDFAPTVRGGMRAWNMTVQYWLAVNVYKRLKWPKPVKEAVTMLTSAFWHGVYPGYYLSMMTIPFILAVEDYYEKKIRRNLGEMGQKIYDWISWIMKMQHFGYMGMAFLLLQVDATLAYWRSIGFIFHGIIALQHAIAQFINLVLAKVEKKLKTSRETIYITENSKLKIVNTKDDVAKVTETGQK